MTNDRGQVSSPENPESDRTAVLVISSSAAQRQCIEKAARVSSWKISVAGGWRDACFVLSRCGVDVIFCDDRLADGTWKDVLSTIAPMPQAPRLVVLSDGVSAGMCAEVMNLGGFDVLNRPLREDDIGRAVAAGCRSLQAEKDACRKRKPVAAAGAARMAAAV